MMPKDSSLFVFLDTNCLFFVLLTWNLLLFGRQQVSGLQHEFRLITHISRTAPVQGHMGANPLLLSV